MIKDGVKHGVRKCDCKVTAILARKLLSVPPLYRSASLQDRPRSGSQRKFMETVEANGGKGSFYIWGDFESGKSHMSVIQFKSRVRAGKRCFFRTSDELVDELQAAALDGKSEILEALEVAEPGDIHLFWDDCDKVDWERTPHRREAVGRLIDSISRKEHSLTVTTNYSIEELAAPAAGEPKLPQYVLSRIDRICRGNFIQI